jgi:hypothetical protein
MYQYYLKIVPTMYVPLEGTILNTNQFSVTTHQKSATAISGESGMPGVSIPKPTLDLVENNINPSRIWPENPLAFGPKVIKNFSL